jgi:two-component system chemotaxis response regulator CheY
MFKPEIKILVIDDMKTMRKIVQKALTDIGFKTFVEAADGVEGWTQITSAQPKFDLIISDWNMPNCSGLDLLKRLRADGTHKSTPFLLLTAESEASQVMEAIKAGVDDYLVKPFSADSLKGKLENISKKRAA